MELADLSNYNFEWKFFTKGPYFNYITHKIENGKIKEKFEYNQLFDKIEVKNMSIKDCKDKMIKHHPQARRLFLERIVF